MKRNKELRAAARQALSGHWGWAILPGLIVGAITSVFMLPSIFTNSLSSTITSLGDPAALGAFLAASMLGSTISTFGGIFATNPLSVGYNNTLKQLYKDSDLKTVPNLFKFGFTEGRYWRNVLGMFLVGLFTFLWTLLFIIPGIIKGYAYSLTSYILVDNPELSPNEARLKSIEMMRGHKWKLFGLDLSFIGWFLLCILSLGIGLIWIEPYWLTSRAAFYRNLVEELNPQPAAEPVAE